MLDPIAVDALARHGFHPDAFREPAFIAFSRKAPDDEVVEAIIPAEGQGLPDHLPLSLPVEVWDWSTIDDPMGDEPDRTVGYTLGDCLAALANPSDEYHLLSLRLANGFHLPTVE